MPVSDWRAYITETLLSGHGRKSTLWANLRHYLGRNIHREIRDQVDKHGLTFGDWKLLDSFWRGNITVEDFIHQWDELIYKFARRNTPIISSAARPLMTDSEAAQIVEETENVQHGDPIWYYHSEPLLRGGHMCAAAEGKFPPLKRKRCESCGGTFDMVRFNWQ